MERGVVRCGWCGACVVALDDGVRPLGDAVRSM